MAWVHIPDDKRKKLDGKSHASIMMRYSKESKAHRLFGLFKHAIICRRDIPFDENTLDITLLNSSSCLLSSDPLEFWID